MGPCSAHRQAGSCQWFCRFHWRQHPRFRSDPASRHNCYCFLFRCPCVFSLSLWFSFSLYIAVVFLLYAEALICGCKTNWRERDKRGELYYRSLHLICQKHESLNVIFLFFLGWPGSTHLTRDPIIRPGRPPGWVSKLCLLCSFFFGIVKITNKLRSPWKNTPHQVRTIVIY